MVSSFGSIVNSIRSSILQMDGITWLKLRYLGGHKSVLDVKPEVHHITVLHYIFFSFNS
jgi:hypothetical protein